MIQKRMEKRQEKKQDPETRNHYGMLSGIFGIMSNLFLFLIKFFIGFFSHSIAIMADAFNSLSDCFSSVVTIMGFHLSRKKPDRLHPYGYARYEYISGIVISFFMLLMGVLFLKSSIGKIIAVEKLMVNGITYLVLLLAILGKIIQMVVYFDFAKALDSNTIKAAGMDARNDAISTSVIFLAVLFMGIFHINLDGYMGVAVSIFIMISSISMIKQTMEPLLGSMPTEEEVLMIKKHLLSCKEIHGIHDLVIHNYGVGKYFVTVHAEVSSNMNIVQAHDIMDNLEKKLKEQYGIYLTIHTDPLDLDDERRNELQQKVAITLREFDAELKIHDFRIVTSDSHTNVIFDVEIPYEKNYTEQELVAILKKKLRNKDVSYYFILEIDRPFC